MATNNEALIIIDIFEVKMYQKKRYYTVNREFMDNLTRARLFIKQAIQNSNKKHVTKPPI